MLSARPGPPPEHAPVAAAPVCVVINPNSFRAARAGQWRQAVRYTEQAGAPLFVLESEADFARAAAAIAHTPPRQLVIIGGDGTLQGILTRLLEHDALHQLPDLIMLGGGRTNLTAADVRTSGNWLGILRKSLQNPAAEYPAQARPLMLVDGLDGPAQAGFFMAAGMIDEVIRDLHAWRAARRGRWAHGYLGTVLYPFIRLLASLGPRRFHQPDLRVQAQPLGQWSGPVRLLLLTTLERVGPGLRPFAARGDGALGICLVGARARAFLRRLPGLLRGRPGARTAPADGYLTGRAARIDIDGLTRFCLDGQEFACAGRRISVRAGPTVTFLEPD